MDIKTFSRDEIFEQIDSLYNDYEMMMYKAFESDDIQKAISFNQVLIAFGILKDRIKNM